MSDTDSTPSPKTKAKAKTKTKQLDPAALAAFRANPPAVLTEPEAATYLTVSLRTLQKEATRPGTSLRRVKIGRRVAYRRVDLEKYLEVRAFAA